MYVFFAHMKILPSFILPLPPMTSLIFISCEYPLMTIVLKRWQMIHENAIIFVESIFLRVFFLSSTCTKDVLWFSLNLLLTPFYYPLNKMLTSVSKLLVIRRRKSVWKWKKLTKGERKWKDTVCTFHILTKGVLHFIFFSLLCLPTSLAQWSSFLYRLLPYLGSQEGRCKRE